MPTRTEYAVRWTDTDGHRRRSAPMSKAEAEAYRNTMRPEEKAVVVSRTISNWEFVPIVETKYVNGVRITTTQYEESRHVDASCHCFGSKFRTHSSMTCPNRKAQS